MNFEVRKAVSADLEPLAALLDETTLDLLQKKIPQWEYPWDRSFLASEMEDGRVYLAVSNSQIVATFSIREITENPWSDQIADPVGQWYLYRVALLPALQGNGLGRFLVNAAKKMAFASKKSLYLDCWAGNQPLCHFYSSAGFDTVGIFNEENYKITLFSAFFDPQNSK